MPLVDKWFLDEMPAFSLFKLPGGTWCTQKCEGISSRNRTFAVLVPIQAIWGRVGGFDLPWIGFPGIGFCRGLFEYYKKRLCRFILLFCMFWAIITWIRDFLAQHTCKLIHCDKIMIIHKFIIFPKSKLNMQNYDNT